MIVASSKFPFPLEDQSMEDAPPPNEPVSVCVDPSHMVAFIPALVDAAGSMVSVMLSLATLHGPPPSGSSVIMVSVAVPLVMSLLPGV